MLTEPAAFVFFGVVALLLFVAAKALDDRDRRLAPRPRRKRGSNPPSSGSVPPERMSWSSTESSERILPPSDRPPAPRRDQTIPSFDRTSHP